MKEFIPGKYYVNILNLVNLFYISIVFFIMKEFILKRNLMNVFNIVKCLHAYSLQHPEWIHMEKFSLINVINPLHITVVSNIRIEHILERKPLNVHNDIKPLYITVILEFIKGHMLERNLECNECDKAFSQQSCLWIPKRRHVRKMPFKCKQCGKHLHIAVDFEIMRKKIILLRNLRNEVSVVKF